MPLQNLMSRFQFVLFGGFLISFECYSQNVKIPSIDDFKPALAENLNDPSLANIREKIQDWEQIHQDKLAQLKELENKTRGNNSILYLIDTVKNDPTEKSTTHENLSFAAHYDFNNNKDLSLMDWYESELFFTRIKLNRSLNLPEKILLSQTLSVEDHEGVFVELIRRYRELRTINPDPNLQRALYGELLALQNFLETAYWNFYLSQIQGVIKAIDESENSIFELFDRNPIWQHRPIGIPRLIPKSFEFKDLRLGISGWIAEGATAAQALQSQHPLVTLDEVFFLKFYKILEGLKDVDTYLTHKTNSIPSLDLFLSDPWPTLRNMKFLFSFEDAEFFNSKLRLRMDLFRNYDSKLISQILRLGGAHLSPSQASRFETAYISTWIDLLQSLGDLSLQDPWNQQSSLIYYVNYLKTKFPEKIAVQWLSKPTQPLPDFALLRESISWKLMKDPEIEQWVAEFQTAFLKAQNDLILEIALEYNISWDQIHKNLEKLIDKKTALNKEFKKALPIRQDEIDAELEMLNDETEALRKLKTKILNDRRLAEINREAPTLYGKKMGWPSAHSPSRLAQIESFLGLTESSRKITLFLDSTKDTKILAELDLNKDGEITYKDTQLRNLFSVILK